MDLEEKTVETKIYPNQIINLRIDKVELPNGKISKEK